jgi:hypothetical protein
MCDLAASQEPIGGLSMLKTWAIMISGFLSLAAAQYGNDYWSNLMGSLDSSVFMYDQSIQQHMQQLNQIVTQGDKHVDASVHQAMQDPNVQLRYQQYVQQSQQQGNQPYDFYSYTYYYLATNGFSQQGVAAWQASETANNAKVQEAYRGYQGAVENYRNAVAEGQQQFYENHWEMGNVVAGNSTWTDPATGASYTLPYTDVQPGQSWYDAGSGMYFWYNPDNLQNGPYYISPDGQYYYPMNPWQAVQ